MTSPLTFLKDRLTVTPGNDGQVHVSVSLPAELFPRYIAFPDALGSFQVVNPRAEAKANSTAARVEAQEKRLMAVAVKWICVDLRSENHPRRNVDVGRSSLVAAGRGGCPGRHRRNGP